MSVQGHGSSHDRLNPRKLQARICLTKINECLPCARHRAGVGHTAASVRIKAPASKLMAGEVLFVSTYP